MRLILFILIFTISNLAYSQTSFVTRYGEYAGEIPNCIKQMGNNYFIGLQYDYGQVSFWRHAKMLKLDKQGQVLSEITFSDTDSSYAEIDQIIQLNDSEFLTIGGCKQYGASNTNIWVMKMDTALNIIWDKKFITNSAFTTNISVAENQNSNLVIGSGLTTGSPYYSQSILLLEITKQGDSIQSRYYTDGNPYSMDIQSLIFINGQYKAFVEGYSAFTPHGSYSQILNLDTELSLIEINRTPYEMDIYMTAQNIDIDRYYLTGKFYSSSTDHDVVIAKLSNNEDSLAYNNADHPGQVNDYTGWKKSLSFAHNNSIYTGGTGNYTTGFYCSSTARVLMLSNYDSLLNCRWTRFYGSDTSCYTLSTLEATSDGGCIIGGMIYTPSQPERMLDAVFIKVDSLGLYTELVENVSIQTHDAFVYPNPGFDIVNIQSGPQIAGSEFIMYDVHGKQVLNMTLNTTLMQMDVTRFTEGTYLWQIKHKGKIVDQGKWIKQ